MTNSGNWINKIIVILLSLILLGVVLAEVSRHRHKKELEGAIDGLGRSNPDINRLQQDISDLFEAENNFRLYTVTYDNSFFVKYHTGLSKIRASVDTLLQNYTSGMNGAGASGSMDKTFREKLMINKKVVDLKRFIDAALKAAIVIDTTQRISLQLPYYKAPRERSRRTDTFFVSQRISRKKGFIGRVKAVFTAAADKDTIMINRNSVASIERDSVMAMTRGVIKSVEHYYRRHLQDQLAGRNKLDAKDRELVLLNFSLIDSLNSMLHGLQAQQEKDQNYHRERLLQITAGSAGWISLISKLAFMIILLLLVLILYNMYRVDQYAKSLLIAGQEAKRQTMAKSNLLASVSHEMRNPLTVINGLTELLYHSELSEEQHEQVKTIQAASGILLSTVNDILDLSKLEAGKMSIRPAPLQILALVREVYAIMKTMAAQKGLTLVLNTEVLSQGLIVRGDAFRLKQVLLNLTGNAIKFTRQGKITIRVFDQPGKPDAGHTDPAYAEDNLVCFEVTDTGIGIPADKIQVVFNEFEQVQQEGLSPLGTGLGLAISQKIVQLHGGIIDVKSEVGKGSVFTVKINFKTMKADETEVRSIPDTAPFLPGEIKMSSHSIKGKRILLVEDNLMILELAKVILEREEAVVTETDNGETAWDLFRAHHFDIVITDINLPGISGVEIARKIHHLPDQDRAHTPILALTGDAFGYRDSAYTANFDDHIIKPFDRLAFLATVQKYLATRSHWETEPRWGSGS